MKNGVVLGALCVALGLAPTLTFARTATFSGMYTVTENRACPTGISALASGSITFVPVKGTLAGNTSFNIFVKYLSPDHAMERDIGDGTFQVDQNNLMTWNPAYDPQKVNVTFGRVNHGIAHSAVALGFTNGCAEQATLTRIGPVPTN